MRLRPSRAPGPEEIFSKIGLVAGLPFWACGLWWFLFAATSAVRAKVSFNINWWSTTFPTGITSFLNFFRALKRHILNLVGTLAMATIMISNQLSSTFFKIFATASYLSTRTVFNKIFTNFVLFMLGSIRHHSFALAYYVLGDIDNVG